MSHSVCKKRIVFSIDPGTNDSGFLRYDASKRIIVDKGVVNNHDLLLRIRSGEFDDDDLVIEGFQCFGMAVGIETFVSCDWAGRFREAWESRTGRRRVKIFRSEVKLFLCRSSRAKDPNVRQALIDKFGSTTLEAIGRKKTPGPLFGVSSHVWSALALAITYSEMDKEWHAEAAMESEEKDEHDNDE